MKIHNPNNLPVIDYRKVKPLQGDLKDLNDKNYEKLKNVLNKRGFTTPLFLWENKEEMYLMDGHQRQRVMKNEDMNDNGSYEVPFIMIEAKTRKEAKAMLLEITSQYGTITQEGLDEFSAELPEFETENIHFDRLRFETDEPKDKQRQIITCPDCGHKGEIKDYSRNYEESL